MTRLRLIATIACTLGVIAVAAPAVQARTLTLSVQPLVTTTISLPSISLSRLAASLITPAAPPSASHTTTCVDPDLGAPYGFTVTANDITTPRHFSGSLATGSYQGPPPSNYNTSIEWGDGTSSDQVQPPSAPGGNANYTIAAEFNHGTFEISGHHDYTSTGSHTARLVFSQVGNYSCSLKFNVFVTTPTSSVAGVPVTFSATANSPFAGTVAQFTDDLAAVTTPSSYTATIAWGDGATTFGSIADGGAVSNRHAFSVIGQHTYHVDPGSYVVDVTIYDPSGGVTHILSRADVQSGPPVGD